MKKSLLKYLFLIISCGLFCTNLFAQAPGDPGDDPMKADSAKYIIALKPTPNNQTTAEPNLLPVRKHPDFIIRKSNSLYLGKTDNEGIYSIL